MTDQPSIQYDADKRILLCRGDWTIASLPHLKNNLTKIVWPTTGAIKIDGHGITQLDSAGAWLLCTAEQALEQKGVRIRLLRFDPQHEKLISIVLDKLKSETIFQSPPQATRLFRIGKKTFANWLELQRYLAFIGQLFFELLRIVRHPSHLRKSSICSVIFSSGYLALPIITLLSFMIGVVITYQMGLQLKNYGANIFIVDLLGLAILREFGPLLTAIMIAGRTGSAFTAELGMMRLNQEIDALDTMGVTPGELLMLPRIIGLSISLPLITVWADVCGIVGGMVMSSSMLGISWYDFLHRFPTVIPLRALLIGLFKAPVFALLISSIGCYQGIQVAGGADSIGRQTTRSVVLSIFFIIVADAIFSILFSEFKL